MKLLGIETSCDETAAAVWLEDRLTSNIVASQEVHQKYGGVVPELASRAHVQLILPTVQKALKEAEIEKEHLDGIAVTFGPGLAGSLLVGLNFAKAMALALDIPIIGVNHIEGHIFSNSVLGEGPPPPFIALIISGGHTQLVLVHEWGKYEILGKTRDDAVGEAFDKAAKMLELSYPGGPAVDKLAATGDPEYLDFPKGRIKDSELDFSYSGLKTAVLYHLQSLSPEERERSKADVAASFQKAAIEILIENSLKALEKYQIDQLALAGGVACNSLLRNRLKEESEKHGFKLFTPPLNLCTDNAAMIVRAGRFYLERGERSEFSLSPVPSLRLDSED
ncbi:MAG: tRNA (adenosine(37)-N6)-threonylcarbamoyltransferase complex transferase subunit TsaD [Caldithrix sp.]|nr:MAG: tRNA (adenosine(37)-N6)-threonylcarbamoyltransferase complex transferase subunit TsaD [Caldithrix sp.]TDJ00191.1 MAG: tRNA (adenosine(37)-N6)-threonylcarbamoyltransferase complex transferase subunit TsaD [Caldithrix sp.]